MYADKQMHHLTPLTAFGVLHVCIAKCWWAKVEKAQNSSVKPVTHSMRLKLRGNLMLHSFSPSLTAPIYMDKTPDSTDTHTHTHPKCLSIYQFQTALHPQIHNNTFTHGLVFSRAHSQTQTYTKSQAATRSIIPL